MSVALMSQVWRLDGLATTDKMVLLALADAANDDGVTWIAVTSRKGGDRLDLKRKTGLSERAVQGAIQRLCTGGYLSRNEKPGRGVIYHVTPAADAPRSTCTPADNDVNPRSSCGETISNHQSSEANASSERRATRLPANWAPPPEDFLKALDLIGDERAALELEKFSDYWRAVPGAKGRKLDWPATFRNWIRRASEDKRHVPNARQDRPSKSDHYADIFAALGAASGRTQQPGGGDRPPPRDEGRVRALPPAA